LLSFPISRATTAPAPRHRASVAGASEPPEQVEIIDLEWQTWIELRRQGANLDSSFEPHQREGGALRKISPRIKYISLRASSNSLSQLRNGQRIATCRLGSLHFASLPP
jgi:hypothetical protein